MLIRCMFCGEETDNPRTHRRFCSGQQGAIEAEAAVEPFEAFARATDPDTSHDAAAKCNVSKLERCVLDTLERHDLAWLSTEDRALTTEQLGDDNPHVEHRDSISPRMKALERKALVEVVGKRANRSGVHAQTWGLTALGRLYLAAKREPVTV